MQRTFEVWLAEVKGVQNQQLPKWELTNYFDTYREDFNTATLPHVKYYDYDTWEMAEHEKKKQRAEQQQQSMATAGQGQQQRITLQQDDERAHAAHRQRVAAEKEAAAVRLTAATMSRDKVQDMLHQQQLRTQMQLAFKMGDKATYRKLKDKLEADE